MEAKREALVARRSENMGILPGVHLNLYRAVFEKLDVGGKQSLDRDSIKPLLRALPLCTSRIFRQKRGDHSTGSSKAAGVAGGAAKEDAPEVFLTRRDVDYLVQALDDGYDGNIKFPEFLVLM